MKILIDADEFMNTLNEAQIEGDEYYKGLDKAKNLLQKEILKECCNISNAKPKICSCYETFTTCEARYNTITGHIDHYVDVEYGRCRGTKGHNICTCGGNEKKCDFYEHKRK